MNDDEQVNTYNDLNVAEQHFESLGMHINHLDISNGKKRDCDIYFYKKYDDCTPLFNK